MVRTLAVVGTGLIGASVGLAAREAGVDNVRGWDVDPDALATAAERGALPRRDLVPDAGRRHGARALPDAARVRRLARRRARRRRPGGARPARRTHEPSPARTCQSPAEPRRHEPDRGARSPGGGGRV